ncbi:MAG TPA: hypothetical protein VMB85_01250 [Bryobacteraceae bacterium]|nr:hypothetical protein [Bryobacteraceae bacterium]
MKIRFLYHADAVAASGYITLPVQETMPAQAAVAAPILGGYASAESTNFRHGKYLSFDRAQSHVVGSYSEKDKAHGTLATTTVEGLNIMDVVTCDRIVARITTKHPESPGDSAFIPLGSRFENLRIAGHLIHIDLATDIFAEHDTWSKLSDAHAKGGNVRTELEKLAITRAEGGGLPQKKGMMYCSLARRPDKLPGGLTWNGHGIYVPHFGTLYLGEYFVTQTMHRLLMLHVDLGCSVEGCYGIGGADGNGGPPPSN